MDNRLRASLSVAAIALGLMSVGGSAHAAGRSSAAIHTHTRRSVNVHPHRCVAYRRPRAQHDHLERSRAQHDHLDGSRAQQQLIAWRHARLSPLVAWRGGDPTTQREGWPVPALSLCGGT